MRNSVRIAWSLVVIVAIGLGGCSDAGSEGEDETDTGPPGSCAAFPACDRGDQRVQTCPDRESCYTRTVCDSTITCVRLGADAEEGTDAGEPVDSGLSDACGGVPTCDPGDEQVETCPDGGSCYTNTFCATTITCLRTPTDAGRDGGPADGGDSEDVEEDGEGGDVGDADGTCPASSTQDPDTSCISVSVCCVNETTGEKCWYSNPCTAPSETGDEWTCGESQCSRDAG